MIPEGWRELQLGNVIKLASGDGRPADVVAVADEQCRNPVYGGNGVLGFSAMANSHGDDIIIGRVGEYCGITRFVPGAKWITDNALYVKTIEAGFDRRFLAIKLQHYDLSRLRAKGGQPLVSQKPIYGLRFYFPPENEQKAIWTAVETWNRAIETVEALIANARAQKQALMQQLLPQSTTPSKKRLPGFSGEWREIRLGAAFSERVERGDDQLPLLSVTQANGVIPQGEAGRRNISSDDQSNYKTVRAGDIAYNTMRMWQGASALSTLTGKVSPAYTIVTPRKGHDALFYAYLFKQPKMIHVFERHSQGLVSDTWNLKYPHLAKIRTCVPDIEEQRAIAAAFASMDDSTRAYETQLTALRQEKAALMQQLLTGKRRIKLPESEVA
ncbi:restriction endonuclease subunit S [Novosphingobium sp. 1949]|uniref:Restriction endonuclease subunit S n=1 Tax=Novosphingobium organovorum TaxID=2930092 RepID=A0ABT0BBW4_9SPHN|nr:restriction endonuclease subunit S [Novosphingobium organovorum]MCJ2182400.1 restriction endonuclease subunit S [Novosphingobium organovorum]